MAQRLTISGWEGRVEATTQSKNLSGAMSPLRPAATAKTAKTLFAMHYYNLMDTTVSENAQVTTSVKPKDTSTTQVLHSVPTVQ